MAFELGTTDINKLMLGTTEINKAYLGSTEVYDNTSNPPAAETGGDIMYVIGHSDFIYQYSLSTDYDLTSVSYASKSIDLIDLISAVPASPNPTFKGVFLKPDGTKLYCIDNASDSIYQIDLSTAWDLSSASDAAKSIDVSSQMAAPEALYFNNDGTKMFAAGGIADPDPSGVSEYALGTAWDISTATFTDTFDTGSQTDSPQGVTFNDDGTKMLVVGRNADSVGEVIFQYTLSTGFDVSTASYDSISLNITTDVLTAAALGESADENIVQNITLSSNGTKLFVVGDRYNSIYRLTLSDVDDVSTATLDSGQIYDVSSQETIVRGVFFKRVD